ncbi:hypothetical protein MTO96_015091 [Rhipicephalus appendiculatus]
MLKMAASEPQQSANDKAQLRGVGCVRQASTPSPVAIAGGVRAAPSTNNGTGHTRTSPSSIHSLPLLSCGIPLLPPPPNPQRLWLVAAS